MIYDYELFKVISLDVNFNKDQILNLLYNIYPIEIRLLLKELKQYDIKELQDIFNECLQNLNGDGLLDGLTTKEFLEQAESRNNEFTYLIINHIFSLKDKHKQRLYYCVFCWYELENWYSFLQKNKEFILKMPLDIYVRPHSFMMLYCCINSPAYDMVREESFKLGGKIEKDKYSQKMSENGKKKGEKTRERFKIDVDEKGEDFFPKKYKNKNQEIYVKSYDSKIKYIMFKYEIHENTAQKLYSDFILKKSNKK